MTRAVLRSLAAVAVLASTAAAQATPGYASANAGAERSAEADVIRRPDRARARLLARDLSREVHVAGTAAQARTRDYVIARMKEWGLETEVREYEIWMPHPTAAKVWRVSPGMKELPLAEPVLAADPTSKLPQYPTVNGYSGAGDATGDVVYVNYGLIEDYAQLDSLGVSVKGKVAVARYGRSFRGIKAREAEKRGAVALIIYSDPADDGFTRGDIYPDGMWRPPYGVQRGSVMNGAGDPTTPGYPSTPGAARLALDKIDVPHIPVIPMGYGNAAELLRGLKGKSLPAQGWQGGLDFRYHVGPGPVKARVMVQDDRAKGAYKKIWNTYGIVRGSEFPDEIVLIGGHRDAWDAGTQDNVSGTTGVLEAARAVAEAVKAGHRPRRTLVFATWDAEEWGLIGSTEYVEDDSLRLLRGGVAYFNLDVAASGPFFGGGGSPSLRGTLRDVVKQVPDPDGSGSVYASWRKRAGALADSAEPGMGDPGGGSDFAGFYNHLGIPISDWGFGGTGGGIYHSAYDTYRWMTMFGDTTYAYHAAAASIGAAMMLRFGNADLLPYDYVEFARTMRRYYEPINRGFAAKKWSGNSLPTTALAAAVDRFESAAAAWNAARDAALAGGGAPSREVRATANAALRSVEKALTRPQGLVGRPWYRNLIYVADIDNGYANMVFPSVNEAVRRGDEALARAELDDLSRRFDEASTRLAAARAAIIAR
ncbi:MAG: M28 family peptidase [Gemmatimonadetes bacterium]|nr:M28 family peptidase [Gemmatimonadota bacterium]